jgi:hypothetical protein
MLAGPHPFTLRQLQYVVVSCEAVSAGSAEPPLTNFAEFSEGASFCVPQRS